MLNYFGRKQDLTCIQVRILYEYLVSFYIKLFIDKMYNLTRIDIKKLSDNDKKKYEDMAVKDKVRKEKEIAALKK